MLRLPVTVSCLIAGILLGCVTTTVLAQEAEPAPSARIRWGIAAAGGPMLGGYSGGAGGIEGRIGMQLTPLFGIYAQPVLLAGIGASANANGASATALGLYGVGALADITLGDLFFVAAGPELLLGGVGTASADAAGKTSSESASSGPFFSITARAGFVFGSKRPDRRKGFMVGLNMHAIFAGDVAVLPLLTLGFEAF